MSEWEAALGPDSPVWGAALLFLCTTSNSTSPAGLGLGCLLWARPAWLLAAWHSLWQTHQPTVLHYTSLLL